MNDLLIVLGAFDYCFILVENDQGFWSIEHNDGKLIPISGFIVTFWIEAECTLDIFCDE